MVVIFMAEAELSPLQTHLIAAYRILYNSNNVGEIKNFDMGLDLFSELARVGIWCEIVLTGETFKGKPLGGEKKTREAGGLLWLWGVSPPPTSGLLL